MPEYNQILMGLQSGNARVDIIEEAKPYLIAALYRHLQLPMLILVSKPEISRKYTEQFLFWNDTQKCQADARAIRFAVPARNPRFQQRN